MDIPVRMLRIGDRVDLEGDPYANMYEIHPQFESEYAVVCGVVEETPDCIAVTFDDFDTVGFPPDHFVRVAKS